MTTTSYLLDTSIVSEPVKRAPDPEVLRRLGEHAGACAIASVVWHELVFGCARLDDSRRKAALEDYLHHVVAPTLPILPYDEAAAAWHGAERARLEARGTPAPFADGQIAAIARTRGLVLVTANTRDFRVFEGLKVEDWTRRPRRRA
ncbi:MAG: type II toxin-antitoxin system VapC family toxin [Deltaproteobacteria bacterium]|nr:type II toxin-antitoxin system VapC family toxin [Deltaproteobacteria bacterium]